MKIRNEKGITLIALAVTIIVMLILAGVSLAILNGDSSISKNAETAKLQNELGHIAEQINLKINEEVIKDTLVDKKQALIESGYIIQGEKYNYVDASKILSNKNKYGKGSGEKDVYILDGKNVVYIDSNGKRIAEKETTVEISKTEATNPEDPKPEIDKNSLITTWRVNANDKILLPFAVDEWFQENYDCTIDWGDGSEKEHVGGENSTAKRPEHTYTQAGDYNISISGKCGYFDTGADSYSETYSELVKKIIKIVSWGDVETSTYCFASATNLVEVASPLEKSFKKCKDDSFNYLFSDCTNLKLIPQDLFKYINENITSFKATFSGCENLKTIPDGLFEKATNVTSFVETFAYCNNLGEIPENLFANNTKVTSFQKTFCRCTKLENVSEQLFDNTPNVTDFTKTFYECYKLKSGPKIWERENENAINGKQKTYVYCNEFDTTGLSADVLKKYFTK